MKRAYIALLLLLLLAGCFPASPHLGYTVITHPDGPLYAGDLVSFEVLAPAGDVSQSELTLSIKGEIIGSAAFSTYGIGRRHQATLWWVWDTSDLTPGNYLLDFAFTGGETWQERVRLRPAWRVPSPEPGASWESTTTECCIIHYITGTDAERDIERLAAQADEASRAVAEQLGTHLTEKIPVTFIPRVIGHGGFAWDGLYLTYLDESYIANEMDIVLHHEFVHYYDESIGGEYLPSLLQEGLAVYLSGGHYKSEALMPRAAALLDLGWYIPIATLAEDFYNQQHEIGYLEAGALVQYLYETYGPGTFIEFYRTISPPGEEGVAGALDRALQENYRLSLAELETEFLLALGRQEVPAAVRADLELTVASYDTIRRYQMLFDPSAHFLTAWLPNGEAMRRRGVVADFTRRPQRWQNWLVEGMLIRLQDNLSSGDLEGVAHRLKWTEWILDLLEH